MPNHPRRISNYFLFGLLTFFICVNTATAYPDYQIYTGCLFRHGWNHGVKYAGATIVPQLAHSQLTFVVTPLPSSSIQAYYGDTYKGIIETIPGREATRPVHIEPPLGKDLNDNADLARDIDSCKSMPEDLISAVQITSTKEVPTSPGEHTVRLTVNYENPNGLAVGVFEGESTPEVKFEAH